MSSPNSSDDHRYLNPFFYISQATYNDDKSSLENWTCGQSCSQAPMIGPVSVIEKSTLLDKTALRAIVGKMNTTDMVGVQPNACVVGFRGTDNGVHNINWLTDVDIFLMRAHSDWGCTDSCKVHSGFAKSYLEMKSDILDALQSKECTHVYTTGHSLGGALATIAACDLNANDAYNLVQNITFEAPRAVNTAMAKYMDANIASTRVTNNKDPVPHLPPEKLGYRHSGNEVYYTVDDATGQPVVKNCSFDDTSQCSASVSKPWQYKPNDHCTFTGPQFYDDICGGATQSQTSLAAIAKGLLSRGSPH